MGKLSDALAGVLDGVSRRARDAYLADDAQNHVFGGYAEGQRALNANLHSLGLELAQRLGSQHVFDLRSADADGERPKRAVRRSMAVAADDDLTRLRQALLGPYDVDDALIRAESVVQRNAEVVAVAL